MQAIRRYTALALVCVMLAAASACGQDAGQQAEEAPPEAEAALEDTGADAEAILAESPEGYPFIDKAGVQARVANNEGKVTMAIFWATWCSACRSELPEMMGLRDMHPTSDLDIFGVALGDSEETLDLFFSKEKLNFPVFRADEALGQEYGISSIPHLMVFNTKGELVFAKPGAYPAAMLDVIVGKYLDE